MKTLYVSDLDNTLLRSDGTVSEYTARVLEYLCGKGLIFTYATARSHSTAAKAVGDLGSLYAVVYNGAFTVENDTGRRVFQSTFPPEESKAVLDALERLGTHPRVFALIDGKERFTYTEKHLESLGAQEYFRTRAGDPRARLGTWDDLYEGDIFTISCTDKREALLPCYERLREDHRCLFYKDSYSPDWYLEILPRKATKACALLRLKEILGCERVVAFGDGVNDFSMFEVADECYAVSNADPRLKEMATGIIGSNDEDGVARYLLGAYEKGELV